MAGCKKQHLLCPTSLPMDTPAFSLAESGPDSANGKGGVSIGRSQEAAFTMSDEPANANRALSLAESGPDSANGKGGVSIARPQEAAFTMSD